MNNRSLAHFPDILYIVFSSFNADLHTPDRTASFEARRTLAIAARTCRGFTGPALRALWMKLPDDKPLADLLCVLGIAVKDSNTVHDDYRIQRDWHAKFLNGNLPSADVRDMWQFKGMDLTKLRGYEIDYRLTTEGNPRAHPNWSIFVEYASRVREITLFASKCPKWCGLWSKLQSAMEGAHILPMLQTVSFKPSTLQRGLTSEGFPLISSSVRQLKFSSWLGNDISKWYRTITDAFLAAPNTLKLHLRIPPSCVLALLRADFSRINHLEVHSNFRDTADLYLLANLPSLHYLSMYSDITTSNFVFPMNDVQFRHLTTLAIEGSWTFLEALFNNLSLPSIHTLLVTACEYANPAAKLAAGAVRCFGTIASRYPSVVKLSVATDFGPPPLSNIRLPTPIVKDAYEGRLVDIIRPLLSLHGIRHLSVILSDYFRLSCATSDHLLMAEAWPELEELHLDVLPYVLYRDTRPYGGPMHGIVHFARHCQRLRTLHLPAMELTEEALEEVDGAIKHHGLRSLIVSKVLCSPGRSDDAAREILKLVEAVFPLAVYAFKPERVVKKHICVVVSDVSRCLGCMQKTQLTPSQRRLMTQNYGAEDDLGPPTMQELIAMLR